MKFGRLLLSMTLLATSNIAFSESSFQYHYGTLKVEAQSYLGNRYHSQLPIHEISMLDTSGELSAAISNTSSQYAAREGAIAEEKKKVREGESLGGPKTISYQWQEVAARDGDVKRYAIRLASTDTPYSFDTISGSNKAKIVSLFEASLIGNLSNHTLVSSDSYMVRADSFWGFRLGLFRDFDKLSSRPDKDRKIDSGYLYLPFSLRIGCYVPFGLRLYAEAGLDPITAVRRLAIAGDKKLPFDLTFTPAIEYRIFEYFAIGMRVEEYRGSLVKNDKHTIDNPEYKQRITTAYINFSG